MIVTKFLNVSAKFAKLLVHPPVFIGSMAMVIRGITDREPNDVDVIIDKRDFEALFGITEKRVCMSGKLRSYYAKRIIDDVQVEALADVEILVNGEWTKFTHSGQKEYVRWHESFLPFINLKDLVVFYEHIGRSKDQEKIAKIQGSLIKVDDLLMRLKNPEVRKSGQKVFRRLLAQAKID